MLKVKESVVITESLKNSFNQMNIKNYSEALNYVVVQHTRRTKETLNNNFVKCGLNGIFKEFEIPFITLSLILEDIVYCSRPETLNYNNLRVVAIQWYRHKGTEELLFSLALQNYESKYIDYLILIPNY